MHTRCVHTTPATRTARITLEFSPAHRALPGGARAASTLHSTLHATPAVLRTGAHPHRHGKQLSRGELPGLQRASRAGGESVRGPAWGSRRGSPRRLGAMLSLSGGRSAWGRGRGSRIGAVLAWFRREVGSCGGRREKREWEEAVSGFSARRRFGTFPVLQSAFLFSAIVSFGARFWCQD